MNENEKFCRSECSVIDRIVQREAKYFIFSSKSEKNDEKMNFSKKEENLEDIQEKQKKMAESLFWYYYGLDVHLSKVLKAIIDMDNSPNFINKNCFKKENNNKENTTKQKINNNNIININNNIIYKQENYNICINRQINPNELQLNNIKQIQYNCNNINNNFETTNNYLQQIINNQNNMNTINFQNNIFSLNQMMNNNNNYLMQNEQIINQMRRKEELNKLLFSYNNRMNNNNNRIDRKCLIKRKGDWICNNCNNLNFTFRTICNRCKIPKSINCIKI